MKGIGIAAIWLLRIVALLVVIWQIVGLAPVITWQLNPDAVTAGMQAMVGIKVGILILGIAVFWALGKAIKKIKAA